MIIAQPFEVTSTVGPVRRARDRRRRRTGRPGRRGPSRPRARWCASTRSSGCRSRRRACSRATRACASGRSTASRALARSSSTRSASVGTDAPWFASRSPAPAGTWGRSSCVCCSVHPKVTLTGVTSERLAGEPLGKALSASARASASCAFHDLDAEWLAGCRRRRSSSRCLTWSRRGAVPVLRRRGRKVDRSLGRLPAARSCTTTSPGTRRRTSIRPGSVEAVYGLPELHRKAIAGALARRLARLLPGRGAMLATAPLLQRPGSRGSTGSSSTASRASPAPGAQGRKIDPMYLYTEANENVQAYGHRLPPAHARRSSRS